MALIILYPENWMCVTCNESCEERVIKACKELPLNPKMMY